MLGKHPRIFLSDIAAIQTPEQGAKGGFLWNVYNLSIFL